MWRSRPSRLTVSLLAAAIVFASCSGDDGAASPTSVEQAERVEQTDEPTEPAQTEAASTDSTLQDSADDGDIVDEPLSEVVGQADGIQIIFEHVADGEVITIPSLDDVIGFRVRVIGLGADVDDIVVWTKSELDDGDTVRSLNRTQRYDQGDVGSDGLVQRAIDPFPIERSGAHSFTMEGRVTIGDVKIPFAEERTFVVDASADT